MHRIILTTLLFIVIISFAGCAVMNDLSYKASYRLPPSGITQENAQKFVAEHSDEYRICSNCGGTGVAKKWDTNFRDICRMCEGKGYVHIIAIPIKSKEKFPISSSPEKTNQYIEDFSIDPGWETNNSEHYHWDSERKVYYTSNYTNSNEYATIPLNYKGGSFLLEFDLKPTDRDTGDVCIGLFGSERKSHGYNAEKVFVLIGGYTRVQIMIEKA